MAIKDSGQLNLSADIGAEVGVTADVYINSTEIVRKLIPKDAGVTTRMSEYYGKSAGGGMGCNVFVPVAPPDVSGWEKGAQTYSINGSGAKTFTVPAGWVFHLIGIKKTSQYGYWKDLVIDGIPQADEWQSSSFPKWFASSSAHGGSFSVCVEVKQSITFTISDSRSTMNVYGVMQQA